VFFFNMIFESPVHKNCRTSGVEILQEYYSLWSLHVNRLSLKSEKVELWTAMICHRMSHKCLTVFSLISDLLSHL
jgi:hypothetical protein